MLRTITPSEMKRVESRVMQETSITGEALMQNAAAHVARAVRRRAAGRAGQVVCLCGTGNNGGDGLAAMRMLAQEDPAFRGVCWLLPGRLSADAQRELERLREAAEDRVAVRRAEDGLALPQEAACAVDALFGTGLSRPLEGMALAACEALQALAEAGVPVVAVDIPSGLNGETGQVMGAAVRACETVTFHRPKPGLYLGQGPDYAGEITVADIGLTAPEAAALDDADGMRVLERGERFLPPRARTAHKGSFGRVVLWAGSRGMAGAAAIAATAALRAGAGLVTVACPDDVVDVVQTLCPCATCAPLPMDDEDAAWEALSAALERADALGAGCGLGQGPMAAALMERLLRFLHGRALPCVLDADALNLLARRPAWLADGAAHVLTPHPGEAARLLGVSTAEILADMPGAAVRIRRRYGAAVVLKGARSVLCAEEGMALNSFGTPAMAKGGSGDALTGIMAALLAGRAAGAYAMDDLFLMQAACALHGLAGERASRRYGERGALATDLCACLGFDFLEEGAREDTRPCAASSPLGRTVHVTVEHRRGTRDAQGRVCELPLGHVAECLESENRWQDACLLGVSGSPEWFEGEVAARLTLAGGEMWVVAPKGTRPTPEEVRRATAFLGPATGVEVR